MGAYGDDDGGSASGSAYLFEKPSGGWANATEDAKFTASDPAASDFFGLSVSISGDTVLVGAFGNDAGSAYLFEKPSVGWSNATEDAKFTANNIAATGQFGYSVAISGDMVVVGAPSDDDGANNSGSAYLFEKPSGGWVTATENAKLTASDATESDAFGRSVTISGNTVVIGADRDDTDTLGDDSGSAYIFKAKTQGISPSIIMYLLN